MAFLSSLFSNSSPAPFLRNSQRIVGQKTASWREPFTPFFFRESTQARGSGRKLEGRGAWPNETYLQYTNDGWNNTPICGWETYRVRTWTSSRSSGWSVVDTVALTPSLTWATTVESTGTPPGGAGYSIYDQRVDRTATTSTTTWTQHPGEWALTTLSEPVTREYLAGALSSWNPLSSDLGNSSLSLHSSESGEGRYLVESVYAYRGVCPGFSDWDASGMVGSLSAYWNGNFTAGVVVETRENLPLVRHARTGGTAGANNLDANGSWSVELTDPTEGLWKVDVYSSDGFVVGAYEIGLWSYAGEGSDPRPLLEYIPMKAIQNHYLYPSYATEGYQQLTMQAHSIMMVSRTGKQYKIHFEKYVSADNGYYDWDLYEWVEDITTTTTPFFRCGDRPRDSSCNCFLRHQRW
jgi:hypothetical protein